MAPLKFMSLGGAALLLSHGTQASTENPTAPENPTPVKSLTSNEVDCNAAINEARKAAGFKELAKGTFEKEKEALGKLCKFIQGQTLTNDDYADKDVTPAFFETDTANCTAAVDYWKSGYSLFTEIPPNYTVNTDKKPQSPYDNDKARSFVALYSSKATGAACGLVTCPEVREANANDNARTREGQAPDSSPPLDVGGGGQSGNDAGNNAGSSPGGSSGTGGGVVKYAAKTGLVCGMKPKVLKNNEAPFSETEWKQIVDAFASSASVAAPTALAIAAAALGFVIH